MSEIQTSQILSAKKLADYLGVRPSTLNSWRQNYGLPFLRLGARVFYVDADFAKWAMTRREVLKDGDEEGR